MAPRGRETGRPQKWTEVFRQLSEEGGILHGVPSIPTSKEGRRGSPQSQGSRCSCAEVSPEASSGAMAKYQGAYGGQERCPEPCPVAGHSESVASSSPG